MVLPMNFFHQERRRCHADGAALSVKGGVHDAVIVVEFDIDGNNITTAGIAAIDQNIRIVESCLCDADCYNGRE